MINEEEFMDIRALHRQGFTYAEIGRIVGRDWRSRTQLELAVVEYIAWFNNDRLHESLGDVPPAECESLCVAAGVQLSNPS